MMITTILPHLHLPPPPPPPPPPPAPTPTCLPAKLLHPPRICQVCRLCSPAPKQACLSSVAQDSKLLQWLQVAPLLRELSTLYHAWNCSIPLHFSQRREQEQETFKSCWMQKPVRHRARKPNPPAATAACNAPVAHAAAAEASQLIGKARLEKSAKMKQVGVGGGKHYRSFVVCCCAGRPWRVYYKPAGSCVALLTRCRCKRTCRLSSRPHAPPCSVNSTS
jgi:hypothetical protein